MQNDGTLARRRATLLKAAAQVGRSITSILDPDYLLERTVDIICDEFDFYYAGVFLVDESGEWAVLRAGRGEAGAAMVAEGHKLKVGGHSMIGVCVEQRKARIALDVGEEPVHFKNPHLPHTRSEMALPLVLGDEVIGALTVQSVEEAAFSDDDITALQAMADQIGIAIHNARLLEELEAAHAELVRTKTFEAIATATIEAIHWIGNKAFPIADSVARLREDLNRLPQDNQALLDSMREDLDLIDESARLIVSVQEHLIGPARERKPRPVLVEDVVKDAVVSLAIPDQVVVYTVAPDTPLGLADTTQLGRALGYILRNAQEAIAEAEEQRIVAEVAPADEEGFVVVRIADTGPGIPKDDLDKIWAAFYTTKGSGHAGLGLSACLQIVKQLDGRVAAFNGPDGGAVFELLLPVAPPAPAAELPSGLSILLVDDDDGWSRFAQDVLQKAGNRVTRSADGQIDPAPFDLILLDDVLESADSVAVLRRLAATGPKTIVVSSGLMVERAVELVQSGAQDVVLKPYTLVEMAEVVGV